MKLRFERAGAFVELQRLDRVLFRREANGEESEQGYFDEAAAEDALRAAVVQLLSTGWLESAETQARRAQLEAKHALGARFTELCARADARAALREHLADFLPAGEALERFLAHVVGLDTPTTGGFVVRLDTGGAVEWGAGVDAPLLVLWLYPDAAALERNEHALFYGDDAGPPEPPAELEGVDWFLEEWPADRYWFTTSDEPEVARCYELDGGLHARQTPPRSPREVLLASLVAALTG